MLFFFSSRTDFYSIVRNRKNSHPIESTNTDTNGGTGLVIMNKPIDGENYVTKILNTHTCTCSMYNVHVDYST